MQRYAPLRCRRMQGVLHARAHCRAAARQRTTCCKRALAACAVTPQGWIHLSARVSVQAVEVHAALTAFCAAGAPALVARLRFPSRAASHAAACVRFKRLRTAASKKRVRTKDARRKEATRATRPAPFSSSLFAGCAWSRALCRACLSAAPESETVAPGVHEPHVGGWRCRTHVRSTARLRAAVHSASTGDGSLRTSLTPCTRACRGLTVRKAREADARALRCARLTCGSGGLGREPLAPCFNALVLAGLRYQKTCCICNRVPRFAKLGKQ